MILSELIHTDVIDPDGHALGKVIDARFVLDGTPTQLLAHARLVGFIISPHTSSSFLGYERTTDLAPWPIGRILRWRHRQSFLLRWEDIAKLTATEIHLRHGYQRFSPMTSDTR